MAHDDLIGSVEACKILRIHKTTLARWVDAGKLTVALKLPGATGAYLYHRADIQALTGDTEVTS